MVFQFIRSRLKKKLSTSCLLTLKPEMFKFEETRAMFYEDDIGYPLSHLYSI